MTSSYLKETLPVPFPNKLFVIASLLSQLSHFQNSECILMTTLSKTISEIKPYYLVNYT
jgi:histidinol dehydrogenase